MDDDNLPNISLGIVHICGTLIVKLKTKKKSTSSAEQMAYIIPTNTNNEESKNERWYLTKSLIEYCIFSVSLILNLKKIYTCNDGLTPKLGQTIPVSGNLRMEDAYLWNL